MFLFIYILRVCHYLMVYLNTSHVLIYPTNSLINVSCFAYLNTSHVLIYRFSLEVLVLLQEFKYISCSYLSKRFHLTPYLLLIFKYISCSYLSGCPAMLGCTAMHLNTSHVLIYQMWKKYNSGVL